MVAQRSIATWMTETNTQARQNNHDTVDKRICNAFVIHKIPLRRRELCYAIPVILTTVADIHVTKSIHVPQLMK